jgi:methylglyoxal synthase
VHALYATASTGTLLRDELRLTVTTLQSGPLGGDQQIGARIAEAVASFVRYMLTPVEATTAG